MSALILKSGNALNAGVVSLDFTSYKNRVLADGGFIANEQAVKDVFTFIAAKGITKNEVFSATAASWGVKMSGDKPALLYSLFGDAGDIVITAAQGNALFYNTTRYAMPVIELKPSGFNLLETRGVTGSVDSVGLCVIAKSAVLATGAEYGDTGTLALADLSDQSTPSEVDAKLKAAMYFSRDTNAELSNTFKLRATSHGQNGVFVGLSDMSKWLHAATYITNTTLKTFNDGVEVGFDADAAQRGYNSNLKLTLGRGILNTSPNVTYTDYLYGDIAEAWCLVNTTEAKMQALSLRASQKYVG